MQAQKTRILADLPARLPGRRRSWLLGTVVASSLLGVVAATAVAPDSVYAPVPLRSVVEHLTPIGAAPISEDPQPFVFDERVLAGDSIRAILRRLNVEDQETLDFLTGDAATQRVLRQLRAGDHVLAIVAPGGRLMSINLPVGRGEGRFTLERTQEGWRTSGERSARMSTQVEMRRGTIRQTLFGATDAAGVPESVATKLAEIFGTEIDFSSDLRRGDEFSVVYETLYDGGIAAGTGQVLAAEFVNQGKKYSVVLHRAADGTGAYYTPDGRGLNQAYLRYPLEFSRISSNFGRRLHPIHQQWRAHNGVDFAAATGTPVKAASDGVVDFVGTQNGYGKIIVLRHRDRYSTAYAHLNGFGAGLKTGMRVKQGELIGYVGSSGWATGPHLHYEIRINDTPYDPMKIALPQVRPLEGGALANFRTDTGPLLQRLALLNRTTIARAD